MCSTASLWRCPRQRHCNASGGEITSHGVELAVAGDHRQRLCAVAMRVVIQYQRALPASRLPWISLQRLLEYASHGITS